MTAKPRLLLTNPLHPELQATQAQYCEGVAYCLASRLHLRRRLR